MKDGAHVILFKDQSRKEVFLIKRDDFPIWTETGGGIEVGESPLQAATREVKEETGFETAIERLVLIYNFKDRKDKVVKTSHVYEGRYLSGEYKPEFPDNIGKWYKIDQLPPDISKSTRRRVFDLLENFSSTDVVIIDRHKKILPTPLALFFKYPSHTLRKFLFPKHA